MDGRTDGQMDGWTEGRTDRRTDRWRDGWTEIQRFRLTEDTRMDGQTETPLPLSAKRGKKSLEYVSIGFHMEGWTDAGTDRQTDGWAV